MVKLFSLLLLIFFNLSCSTKRDLPERFLDILEKQAKVVRDSVLEDRVDTEARLPENFALAVYFRPNLTSNRWKWSREDKEEVLATLESMKSGKLGRVFELVNYNGTDDVSELRRMGLQQGAHGLLLVQGAAEVESNFNPWALTYLAVVPLFFVEGNDVSGAFISQAVLWDTRKSFIHLGVQSEGDWSMKRPAIFRQKDRAVGKSKEEALSSLKTKLKKNFQEAVL